MSFFNKEQILSLLRLAIAVYAFLLFLSKSLSWLTSGIRIQRLFGCLRTWLAHVASSYVFNLRMSFGRVFANNVRRISGLKF